ncbi:MAG: hypothetical protein RBU45_26600 [Myxococcota bacterium]|nr:hypothetical protein [Myxococcota bacterium]
MVERPSIRKRPPGAQDTVELAAVDAALLVLEHVIQPAIEDRIEGATQRRQIERIAEHEGGGEAARSALLLGEVERSLRRIEPPGLETAAGQLQDVLARAAAEVEHRPGQRKLVEGNQQLGLGTADVPGRGRTTVDLWETVSRRHDGTVVQTASALYSFFSLTEVC